VVRRLKRRGHDVAVHSNFGHYLGMGKWQGVPIYPSGYDNYSQDNIWGNWLDFNERSSEPAIMITLCDVWVLKNPHLSKVERILSWVPIDHAGLVPGVAAWLRRDNVTPVAMSKHGKAACDRAGIESVYIPHALEKHWKPTPVPVDPWPGRFVVTIPNANKGVMPSRKSWGENILAFSVFAQRHPEALLYLHTEAKPAHGIDLVMLIESVGLTADQVQFINQYDHRIGVDDQTMASIYTRSDVLLSATAGEGFGLPVLEAQACGTRVIVSNFSAQPELVGDGWIVEVQGQWNPTQGGWFATPFVESIVEGLEQAFARWGSEGSHSEEAVEFARQYDADRVFGEAWAPLVDRG
jgi:glycosyltransferase involved in cell wall biosynthesis